MFYACCEGLAGICSHQIRSTTTEQGLRINVASDENLYTAGIKVIDEELRAPSIEHDEFHGEWNYKLLPRNSHTPT
jgi:Rhodopirellula transposase DDE domain